MTSQLLGVAKQLGHRPIVYNGPVLLTWSADIWFGNTSLFRTILCSYDHDERIDRSDSQMSPQPRLRLGCGDIWGPESFS